MNSLRRRYCCCKPVSGCNKSRDPVDVSSAQRYNSTLLLLLLLLLLLPFYGQYTGQPVLAGSPSYELEDFLGAKVYCPHALADGN